MDNSTSQLSRREFLKTASFAGAAFAVSTSVIGSEEGLLRAITPTEAQAAAAEEEKVYTSACGDGSPESGVFVTVKNGRVIRIRPIKYTADEAKPWQIKAKGKTFEPPRASHLKFSTGFGTRQRIYNPMRVKYPLKRVGFEPGGKGPIDNRGRGEFVRISWDEALDIVVRELKRTGEAYGPSSRLFMGDGHGSPGNIHANHAAPQTFLGLIGGHTRSIRNPDSWEGWCWGSVHTYGFDWNYGFPDQNDILEDVMQNSELLIDLGDSESTAHGTNVSVFNLWFKELGIKKICITPDLNQNVGLHADTWIPVKPGTDHAWPLAVAYVWITEGTYYKNYVYTHGYGFDKWKDYVLGVEDGVPKTPEWAEKITGIKARTLRALAREWASKTTALTAFYSAGCRTPYSTEWCRMAIYLLTMQGMGRPGVYYYCGPYATPVNPKSTPLRPMTRPAEKQLQLIYKPKVPEAILNPPISWYGSVTKPDAKDQCTKQTYPKPGMSKVHMIWMTSVSHVTNWNNGNKFADAFMSPDIEFIVVQHPWLENDALFADIVLPGSSQMERDDIMIMRNDFTVGGRNTSQDMVVRAKKCIEPLWESKSDYETVSAIAERYGLLKEYNGGKTVLEWIKYIFDQTKLSNFISYDDFEKKGYYVWKYPDGVAKNPGMRWYYQKAEGEALKTPSGKIEFYAQTLAKNFPDDKERPPVAHYISDAESHQESLKSPRAKKYPLLCMSTHPRYRWHSKFANCSWVNEIPGYYGSKMKLGDYFYETAGIHPTDANARKIKHGDIVKIHNERGAVLCAAFVTERMMPGTVSVANGSNYDPIVVGKLDKGGCINTITPLNTTSKNATGMAVTAFLIEVDKWAGPVPLSIREMREKG